jgi:acetylornithine deacetylase
MPVEEPEAARASGKSAGPRFNVYATAKGVTPEVVFSTHFDTVPPHMELREDEEYIYGRGSCDAKGILAAQVAAADRLRADGINVGMLFVVGEERDSAGAKVANENPRGSKFLINGEPTDNCLALGTKGALRVELRAKGKMAHSAYPELGESATAKLVEALHDLLHMELPIDPVIGETTLNIGTIQGGHAPNVIADKAEAQVLIRLVGPSDVVKKLVLETVGDRADVSFTLDLSFVRLRNVEGIPGLATMVAKYATDIPSLTKWGEPLLLGPGSIHVAHTPDERLSKKELVECVGLYVELVKKLVQG